MNMRGMKKNEKETASKPMLTQKLLRKSILMQKSRGETNLDLFYGMVWLYECNEKYSLEVIKA